MKKFSKISVALLSVLIAIVFFAACQKEQSTTVAQDTASAPTDETKIVGVATSFGEGVTATYAAALAANYYKKYSDDDKKSQYVIFDLATLKNFIDAMKANGSTKIYVNFGVYGNGAPAVANKDNGRLTVFFTGDKIPAPSSRYRGDAATTDEFLNHGEMFP